MNQFCTSCGAPDNGSAFCTSCGAMIRLQGNSNSKPSTVHQNPQIPSAISTSDSVSAIPKASSDRKGKRALKYLAIATIIVGGSLGGYAAGRVSVDLKKERSIAFDNGFEDGRRKGEEAGYADGFQSGKDSGYRDGYLDGCYFVFDKIGPDLIAIEYPWYDSNVYGYRWNKYDVC